MVIVVSWVASAGAENDLLIDKSFTGQGIQASAHEVIASCAIKNDLQ